MSRTNAPRPNTAPFSSAQAARQRVAENEQRTTKAQLKGEAVEQARARGEAQAKSAQQARAAAAHASSQAAAAAAGEITDALTAEQQDAASHRPNIAAAIAGLRMGPGAPTNNLDRWRNAIMLSEVLGPPKGM